MLLLLLNLFTIFAEKALQDLNLYIPSKTHNNACLSCLKITNIVVMRPVCSKEVVHHSGYCINVNQEENLLFSHLGKFQQESKVF